MMWPWEDESRGRRPVQPRDLLEFRPWMLALAVFLACAIGIAIMEQARTPRSMWAQADASADVSQHHGR